MGSCWRLLLFIIHGRNDHADNCCEYDGVLEQSVVCNHVITSSPNGEETKKRSSRSERLNRLPTVQHLALVLEYHKLVEIAIIPKKISEITGTVLFRNRPCDFSMPS